MTPEQIAKEKAEKEATKVIVDQAHKSISKAVKSCRDKLKEFLDKITDPGSLSFKKEVDAFAQTISVLLTVIISAITEEIKKETTDKVDSFVNSIKQELEKKAVQHIESEELENNSGLNEEKVAQKLNLFIDGKIIAFQKMLVKPIDKKIERGRKEAEG